MSAELSQLTVSLAEKYRLERELGRGGMATVYLARDLKHDRRVAIKVLHPELAAVLGAERFLAEIRTTANLQHPHILPRTELKYACGLCHLPDGQGRSENATVSGLPEAYVIQQIVDMRTGARAPAKEFTSSTRMKEVAVAATDAEIAAAAKYFSGVRPRKQYTVRESSTVPKSFQAGGLYALRPGNETEPLGDRMMEISDDIERHELRDPGETFTVYVQPGTLAKGQRIALDAPPTSPTRCAQCHGEDLRGLAAIKAGQSGQPAPAIAGRSPFYMLRQLAGFRTKTRNGTTSAPMQAVAAALSLVDMIAAAAYAGSRTP